MNFFQRADTSFEQVIAQLPPEVKITLAPEQMDALRLAFRQMSWKNHHPIDIRLAIPFPKPGFYMVFLAGRERRSPQRLRADSLHHRRQTIVGLTILTILAGAFSLIGFAAVQFLMNSAQREAVHPTAIPWLNSKADCEKTGRNWDSGQCWDSTHSPDF